MARTPPPNITPTPTPAPQRGDRATFSSRVDAFIVWLTTAVGQFSAVALNVYNNAVDAFGSATSAGASANEAAASAANANRDAQTATMAPGTSATSSTSLSIGYGSRTFTLAQTGKLFKKGNTVTIATSSAGDNWMAGPITAFDSASGVMTVNVTNISGTGTFTDWVVSLSGAGGLTGVVNEQRANNIASASTVNLTAATGNLVHITGTTTINAFTLQSGAERSVIFDGALTLTHSAGLLLPGAANIVSAPGDRALIRGDTNGAIVTHYQRASGLQVVGGVISKEYISPDQLITPNGGLTLAHGLGTRPKLIQAYLRCIADSNVNGYTAVVGDIVPVNMQFSPPNGVRIRADNSVLIVNYGVGSNSQVFNNYPDASFRFFVEAFA